MALAKVSWVSVSAKVHSLRLVINDAYNPQAQEYCVVQTYRKVCHTWPCDRMNFRLSRLGRIIVGLP